MNDRWRDLGPGGEATVQAAFVALHGAAVLDRPAAVPALPSPAALWAHVTGAVPLPPADLAAALLAHPPQRDTLEGLLRQAALAVGPRVAAAATGARVTERGGAGFHLRLLPAGGAAGAGSADPSWPDQTWVLIALDRPEPAPTRLTVLPAAAAPVSVPLEPPVDGVVQLLAETGSALVEALGDPASAIFLQ